jgi:hypothetical protein
MNYKYAKAGPNRNLRSLLSKSWGRLAPIPVRKPDGELDARTDIESLADFFESTLAGIRIPAKAGKTRPALRRIAEVASGTFADVKSSVL